MYNDGIMKFNWPRLAPIFYQFSGTKCFIQPHYTHANVKNNKLWFLFLFVSRISRNSISISVNGIHVSFIFWGCWLHGSIVLFVTYIWLTVSIKLYFWYLIIFFFSIFLPFISNRRSPNLQNSYFFERGH